MDSIEADNPHESTESLKDGISKFRSKLTEFKPKKAALVNTKAQNTPANCPAQNAKPQELNDKQKLEEAKKEKTELFKELKAKDISPKEALNQLSELKKTFSALDTAFKLKINTNQKASDSYKPSHHTDIDGNNTKAADHAFYSKNNASTQEQIRLRSEVNKEMRSINNQTLQEEMRFLRN